MTSAGRVLSCYYCSQRIDLPNPECPKAHLHEAPGRAYSCKCSRYPLPGEPHSPVCVYANRAGRTLSRSTTPERGSK
jgi:hypothetical protein